MNPGLREGESLERKITVILTQRDILLLKLCLQLVDRDYTRGGALRFDIQSLRDKLSMEQQVHDRLSPSRESRNHGQKGRKSNKK